jgi:mono/diheme cytochrome c family protein
MAGRRLSLGVIVSALTAASIAALGIVVDAHKPITSKYTYNADVFPIVRERCAACHVTGGIAPMSLVSYKDALPWAESIRQELIAERMPPWFADPAGPPVRGAHALSASEIDALVTWATGGTPEGDPAKRPPDVAIARGWPAGDPDVVLAPSTPHTIPSDVQNDAYEFSLATSFDGPRWIRGADLLPGDPAIVRDASVSVDGGPLVLAWVPGERAAMTPDDAGFLLPPGARLRVRIHYRKSWQDERAVKTDLSKVGLYFGAPSAKRRPVYSIDAEGAVGRAVVVLGVRPVIDKPYGSLEVRATTPSASAIVLLRLHNPQPGWPRRYWLEQPVSLPAGSRVEVATTAPLPTPDDAVTPAAARLSVSLDLVER